MVDLNRHVGTRRKVRIERKTPSEPLLNGYIIAIKSGLVLMHVFHDFIPHGYCVIREKDIVSIRRSKYERLWDRMLAGEGMLAGLDTVPKISLSSVQTVIKSAAEQFQFIIVECEDEHEDVQDFYLGVPVKVTRNTVHLRHVNALAKWEDEISVIPAAEITKVQINAPYANCFAKYIVKG